MFRKNVISSLIKFSFAVVVCLTSINQSSAQSRAVNKPSGEKPVTKTERRAKARAKSSTLKIKKQTNAGVVAVPLRYYGVSESLSALAARAEQERKQSPVPFANNEREIFSGKPVQNELFAAPSAFVQTETTAALAATQITSFEGLGAGMSGYSITTAPPDATLAIGLNHVVVWVNSHYAVFNKSGARMLPGNGFAAGNTLFQGMGNECETTNKGDPVLQYDRFADRWILSQFAFSSNVGPFLQCFAVSTSGDPTGTYHRYSFSLPDGYFNDYGKIGVWTDAYYASYIAFTNPSSGSAGSGLCAYDKNKMLRGEAAVSVCSVGNFAGTDGFLPADLDGYTPPANSSQGGLFAGYSLVHQAIRIIKLKPDFVNQTGTLNDGFGGEYGSFVSVPVGATTVACNGIGGTCIEQPGETTKLDSFGDRLMYRLAYRNRSGTDSLLVSHAVDPDAAGARSSAVRWYEIRDPFSRSPVLYQNSTYDPGAAGDRWMSSLAMNRFGSILLGYNVVNAQTNLKPSIAVTGRLQNDPLNTMQGEAIAQAGVSSQAGGLTRWGDYTTMQVDPADDATFWYVGQYVTGDGFFTWNTRVFSYKFVSNVAGQIIYGTNPNGETPRSIQNVSVSLTGDAASNAATNAAGSYVLNNLFTGGRYTITPAKSGSANGITALDATLVLRHIASGGTGQSAFNDNQKLAADANGAGGITALDATLILRYVAASGQNTPGGLVGNWKFLPARLDYAALNDSLSNQNYAAILIGEVSGNWTP